MSPVRNNSLESIVETSLYAAASGTDSKGRNWTIRTVTEDDREAIVTFLTQNSFPLYGDGKALSKESAQKVVSSAIQRAECGIPFTRFAICDEQDQIIGECALGFGDLPGRIQIAGRALEAFQNSGIGKQVVDWWFQEYLPQLHRRGFRLPVYAEGQDNVEWSKKEVKRWIDLTEVVVEATTREDNLVAIHLLESQGFKKESVLYKTDDVGNKVVHRLVYTAALCNFLPESRSRFVPENLSHFDWLKRKVTHLVRMFNLRPLIERLFARLVPVTCP